MLPQNSFIDTCTWFRLFFDETTRKKNAFLAGKLQNNAAHL